MNVNFTALSAGFASLLGVVSTVIGINATMENQALKVIADRQAIQIARQDAEIRSRTETRAETESERDYAIRVFDKASAALESGNTKQQRVALALIATLPDAELRERLSGVFQASPVVEDAAVRDYAQAVQQQAQQAVMAQRQAAGVVWNIDVFWCTAVSRNEGMASGIYTYLASGENGRVRLRSWSSLENARPGYQVKGLEIRAEDGERDRAGQLKTALDKLTGAVFTIKPVANRTVNYLSVFVCAE